MSVSIVVWCPRLFLLLLLAINSTCGPAETPAQLPTETHGLHFDSPAMVWDEAIPLGNGMLGALVWGDGGPIRISLDRADLWDLRRVPEFESEEYNFELMRQWHNEGKTEDLIRVYETPYERPAPTKIPAGRIEISLDDGLSFQNTSLDVRDAIASMRFSENVVAQFLLHATEPVGFVRIESAEDVTPELIPPPFAGRVDKPASGGIGAGDLTQLGYEAPSVTSGRDWRAFHQAGAEGFHFAAYLKWRRFEATWEAAWSVASSWEGNDPLKLAKQRVDQYLEQGFERASQSHRSWWQRFWSKSSISLPNPIVERQWYLDQYKFGSASRRGAPPITLQAVWTADDGQLPPWKGDYHHDLNTQLSYWPCYSGNHLDEGLAYLDWLWDTRETGRDWTRRFFRLPGLNVPMTADLNGRQIGGWRQYTHSSTTAAWLAHHFYLHWKYSGDRHFLETRAYPYLKEASVFLEAFTAERNNEGFRTFPLTASPEINDNRPEAWFPSATNYDLSLARWLFGASAELATELGLLEEAGRWQNVLTELPELSVDEDGSLLVAKGHPLEASHRHFSHLMAIHPLGLLDWDDGPEARRTIQASLEHLNRLGSDWWTGYSFSWLANLAARARDGETAQRALEIFSTAFTLRNSFHCNGDQSGQGHSRYTYRPFTLEGNFAAAAAVQEMLLQSQRGQVRIFPAVPESWQEVSFSNLRAVGGFLITAKKSAGQVEMVEILSETGGICRVISPFTGEPVSYDMKPGQKISLRR